MARQLTLEERITRIEKLINRTPVKNEGYFEDDELGDWVEGYVMDELSADYRWERDERDDGLETSKSFERAFKRLANRHAPELIDEIMEACADEFELEPEDVEEYRDYITARAADAAKGCLDTYFKYAESRIRRNKRTLRESCANNRVVIESVDDYAVAEMGDAWDLLENAIQNADTRALNKFAKAGRTDMMVPWIVKCLINNDADLNTTKAACRIMMPAIRKDYAMQRMAPETLKFLNNTDNEYLIDFLIKNGFAENIVGRGRKVSPLIMKVLDDNGISYADVRRDMRRELRGLHNVY